MRQTEHTSVESLRQRKLLIRLRHLKLDRRQLRRIIAIHQRLVNPVRNQLHLRLPHPPRRHRRRSQADPATQSDLLRIKRNPVLD